MNESSASQRVWSYMTIEIDIGIYVSLFNASIGICANHWVNSVSGEDWIKSHIAKLKRIVTVKSAYFQGTISKSFALEYIFHRQHQFSNRWYWYYINSPRYMEGLQFLNSWDLCLLCVYASRRMSFLICYQIGIKIVVFCSTVLLRYQPIKWRFTHNWLIECFDLNEDKISRESLIFTVPLKKKKTHSLKTKHSLTSHILVYNFNVNS